jgi:hypothetical protein
MGFTEVLLPVGLRVVQPGMVSAIHQSAGDRDLLHAYDAVSSKSRLNGSLDLKNLKLLPNRMKETLCYEEPWFFRRV